MKAFRIIVLLAVAASCVAKDVEIISPNLYVAPDGSDSNRGTIDKPFATLARARDAVRGFKIDVPKPVTVLVREGTYYLGETLVFGPGDSGTDFQPITYAAYGDEKPILSGGAKLDAKWKPYRDGIMKCSVVKGMDFDQLFINGKRQKRARYPDFNPDKPLVTEGGSYINGSVDRDGDKVWLKYDLETFTKKKLPAILGDKGFIKRVKKQFFERKRHAEVPEAKFLAPELKQIRSAVSKAYGTSEEELLKSRRGKQNEGRDVAIYLTRQLRLERLAVICREYGLSKESSAGSVVEKVRNRIERERAFRKRIQKVERLIYKS